MGPEAIKAALVEHFGGQQADFYCELLGPPYRTKKSVVYCGDCSLYSERVAIKWVQNAAGLIQYDALIQAEKMLGSAGEYSVPHPIAKLENEKIFVMEWIEGKSLSKLLSQKFLSRANAVSYVNRAGCWLHRFHKMEAFPHAQLPFEKRTQSLRTDIAAAQLEDDTFTRAAFRLLEETREFAGNFSLPQGVIHGDFTPDNIVLSEGRTVGLDFALRHRNVVVFDLANFIVHMLLRAWEPTALFSGLLRRRYLLVSSFLDGYQAEGSVVPYGAIAWLRLQILLQTYAAHHRRAASPKKLYHIYCIRYEIRRSVEDLTEAVRKFSSVSA